METDLKSGRVLVLIDADNVSADVIEQALAWVVAEVGAAHVRRAYGTAEAAVKHQALLRRLGIRPMVNLASGKNSTDIALAVDAVALAASERPAVAVIVSSDSDFAPLVLKLREFGCRVVGIGQTGKVGTEVAQVYDRFVVLTHQARRGRSAAAVVTTQAFDEPVAAPTPTPAPAPAAVARKGRGRASKAASAEEAPPGRTPVSAAASMATEAPTVSPPSAPRDRAPAAQTPGGDGAEPDARRILDVLPELAAGQTVALTDAGQRLRAAQLLSKRGSSLKLFARLPGFHLQPAGRPREVAYDILASAPAGHAGGADNPPVKQTRPPPGQGPKGRPGGRSGLRRAA